MNKNKIVAIVPMKHTSERVPGKNYKPFGDKLLFEHILSTLLACETISQVVVDTDSDLIMDKLKADYPEVLILVRPEHLRPGDTPMNDVLLNIIGQVPADFYMQTHSTNPLLSAATISNAVDQFLDKYPIYDSLFGVTKLQTRLWDGMARAVNHNPNILLPTQELPPIYEENSCIYIFTKEILEQKHNRIGNRPQLFEIDKVEALDIDTPEDFVISEMFYKSRKEQ